MYCFPPIYLTIDPTTIHDAYVIIYDDYDDCAHIRIMCDATEMDSKGLNKPGLARYAVINESRSKVVFARKGTGTWGFRVQDYQVIDKGEEIFRAI